MRTYRPFLLILPLFLTGSFTFAQSNLQMAPLPGDPMELVTGATHVVSDPQERGHVLALLEHARENADLHTPGSAPFILRVSFSASGNVLGTGSGEMEETWLSPQNAQWTAHLGNFQITRTLSGGLIFDDRQVTFIPIRVHMLRDALFWPINFGPPGHILIRTANASWRGKEVTCILTSGGMADPTPTPGRRWWEREFCVDAKTGLLQILSDAPGIYFVYDYAGGPQFHGRSVPKNVSVFSAGKSVLEAHLESMSDATNITAESLASSHAPRRFGPVLSGATRFPHIIHVAPGAATVQPVIVHAILDPKGEVMDAELIEMADAALSQSALDIVKHTVFHREEIRGGRMQTEAFINVQFVSGQ